ncbi:MAG: hypothetical protein ACP6IS_01730 [Candidatus Asgardarchaeia archaeon]
MPRRKKKEPEFQKRVVVYIIQRNPEEKTKDDKKLLALYEYCVVNDFLIFNTIVDSLEGKLERLDEIQKLINKNKIDNVVVSVNDFKKIRELVKHDGEENRNVLEKMIQVDLNI